MKKMPIIIALVLFSVPGLIYAETTAELPKITSIAVHNGQPQQYFAATNADLYSSEDSGLTWSLYGDQRPTDSQIPGQCGISIWYAVSRNATSECVIGK